MKKDRKDHTQKRKDPSDVFIPHIPDLECQKLIGSGHFSSVFKGSYKGRSPVSIKIINSNYDRETIKEIYVLKKIKGCPHTINIIDALKVNKNTNKIVHRYSEDDCDFVSTLQETEKEDKEENDDDNDDNDSDYYYSEEEEKHVTILIIDYIEAMSLHHFYHHVKLKYFKLILHDIFESLAAVHSRNIIHRDITENNVLITPDFKNSYLIDWGCSAVIEENKPLKPNAGSRQFRSPEMLFGYKHYDTKCDIWSVGVYIWSVLCGNCVPWRAANAKKVLLMMTHFFGNQPFLKLASSLNISLEELFGEEFIDKMKTEPTKSLEDCFSKKVKCLQDPLLISLMKDLLKIDPAERPTAEDILQHEFFTNSHH